MILLRRVIGDTLRSRRLSQQRTLREVSTGANVSLGYLSEVERGQKEASSELLASICEALDVPLSQVLREVSDTLAISESPTPVLQAVGGTERTATHSAEPAAPAVTTSQAPQEETPAARSATPPARPTAAQLHEPRLSPTSKAVAKQNSGKASNPIERNVAHLRAA